MDSANVWESLFYVKTYLALECATDPGAFRSHKTHSSKVFSTERVNLNLACQSRVYKYESNKRTVSVRENQLFQENRSI